MNDPLAKTIPPDVGDGTPPQRGSARERVERTIRHALLTGRFVPGRPVTLRGLAQDLGVSPMPIREVIRSLAAENALDIRPNGRIEVPRMTPARLVEIMRAREMLEPELAAMATGNLSRADAKDLTRIDDAIDRSIESGDAEAYMRLNHDFHFRIYRAAESKVFLPLVESLWLQFAPFMRIVYGRVGTAALEDHHKDAIAAIIAGDRQALKAAIAADIGAGMHLLQEAGD
ncbi:GntR family transcriptional regulator [Stappia sp. F7233]|uniref:GntR family transcriptional regulator n=1 Tax=Stappia albiluteola TaxID=2758565 RepID=A0A839AHD7_9HYPH|nr:GntR family transcriptional regulator [Stappia albiluteola]MBA5778322.1 GntR family transcriptional regulator [Stappia albiluteola]